MVERTRAEVEHFCFNLTILRTLLRRETQFTNTDGKQVVLSLFLFRSSY